MALWHPCIPDLIHGREVFHIPEVDGRREHMFAVRAGLQQERLHLVQHRLSLLGDAFCRVSTHLATEIDGVLVDDDAAHPLLSFLSIDTHTRQIA